MRRRIVLIAVLLVAVVVAVAGVVALRRPAQVVRVDGRTDGLVSRARVTGPALSDVATSASEPAPVAGKLAKPGRAPLAVAEDEPASREVIVRFAAGVSATDRQRAAQRSGFTIVREIPDSGWFVIAPVDSRTTAADLVAAVADDDAIETAEPDGLYHPFATRPNDTYFSSLWGMENTGQSGGVPGADAKAVSAWDWSRGTGTVVAVIDTGVDFSHLDLAGKQWVNADEVAGNGLDDDGNGYIDDVNGFDFLNRDATVFDFGDGDQHGTHVAGTVGANTGNARGVSGIGWNTRIMSLKFLGQHSGAMSDAAEAIRYAVDNGAHVINASWGGAENSQAVIDAIQYAADHGVLFVAAAGNDALNIDTTPRYPASYPATNIISVAALDRSDALASFSNNGATSVDLGAPGVAILSTIPRWAGALHVEKSPYEAVFCAFPVESITDATVRTSLITRSMGTLATDTANPVLVVDDAWSSRVNPAYEPPGWRRNIYTAALAGAGYSNVTTWSTEVSGTPTIEAMTGKTVVWFTGAATFAIPSVWPEIETYGTLTTAERSVVGSFLDGGGRLLISSGDLTYEMMYLAATKGTLTWMRTYLHARHLADDPGTYYVIGRSGALFNGLMGIVDDPLRYSDGQDDVGPYDSYATPLSVWPHDYIYMDGTSMAAPHVAGTIALMRSRMPALGAGDLKARLLATADPVASLTGKSVTGARLDAAEAVGQLDPPADLRAWTTGTGSLQLAWRDATTLDFATTKVLARFDGEPTGPTDASATVVYQGTAQTTPHTGLVTGQTVYYAAYSLSTLGQWSLASRLTTVVAEPPPGAPIPVGSDVTVSYGDVSVTFDTVTAPGWLSVTEKAPAHDAPAGRMWVSGGYYDIHPVGVFSTPVDIAISYDPAAVAGSEEGLAFRHYVEGSGWEDITVSVDAAGNRVLARVDSFSDFGLDEPLGPLAIDAGTALTPVGAGVVVLGAWLIAATRKRRARA